MKTFIRIAFFCAVFFACVFSAFSHPHIFMDSKIECEMNGQKLNGLWVEWTFDAVFSADLIANFDIDRNGSFSSQEINSLKNYAFWNLRKYGYFTFIRQGNKRINPEANDPQFFSATQKNRLVTYKFYVSLKDKNISKDFSIALFDTTFYCAIDYVEPAISFSYVGENSGTKPKTSIGQNKEYPVYYNPMGASNDMQIYTKWQKGLETAYPYEIRVYF